MDTINILRLVIISLSLLTLVIRAAMLATPGFYKMSLLPADIGWSGLIYDGWTTGIGRVIAWPLVPSDYLTLCNVLIHFAVFAVGILYVVKYQTLAEKVPAIVLGCLIALAFSYALPVLSLKGVI